jgi:undecaprenyl phosphate-alpha-L-ara4N flippase subunit ArnE
MEKKWIGVFLMVVCTFLVSLAQILYKIGAMRLPEIITNYPAILGILLYGIGALVFVIALKFGEVTVLYPIIATSFIWVSILSNAIFSEPLNIYKWIGIASIFIGISIIAVGSKKKGLIRYTEAI